MRMIIEVVEQSLSNAGCSKSDLNGIAVTQGPGLVGSLMVGLNFAKAMAYGLGLPWVGVNHLEGHLYSALMSDPKPEFPFVGLIVSGGHTILAHVSAPFRHRILGQTRDDAAGEAFDKVARMLHLGYPGGPLIDALASEGNPRAVEFPRTTLEPGTFDFSFSGIKTAVLYHLKRTGIIDEPGQKPVVDDKTLADICASFQQSVVDVLVRKTVAAAAHTGARHVAVAGGVSANSCLRKELSGGSNGLTVHTPPLEYCMDNGAMIAYTGWMKLKAGLTSPFDLPAVANLELVSDAE